MAMGESHSRKRVSRPLLCALLCSVALPATARADRFYTTSSSSAVSRVETTTGAGLVVGFSGRALSGATYDVDNRIIVTFDNGMGLATASSANGALTTRCSTLGGTALVPLTAIEISRDGVMYGVNAN